ncbi:MAG TPA: hypothetical protein VJT78_12120 [Candidatus Dormibacteraeota bacterium]|nr:hypothetical protein [Candidatus Dormibacteraeota bacterium]
MAVASARFCGRCGAQVAPGSPYCGRCGAPAGAALAPQPIYTYPVAPPRAAYPTPGRFRASQVAIAGVMIAILAVVTVVVTAFAVSHFTGGGHSPCTVDCAPKIVTPLTEGATFRSTAYGYQLNYSSRWKVRSEDASGIVIGTTIGSLQVTGMHAGDNAQVLSSTVSALPTGTWQNVMLAGNLKGAHLGDQDGLGSVYSANLVGASSTATPVRLAVIVATRNGVTVVVMAVDPADPKNSPNGMPESQLFDYVCTEFQWAGTS